MNLKEIAQMAVDEAVGSELPDGVKMTDNGDGTVTYSMEFSLDPEVQKEMSKAMPKGEKREDQVDKVEKVKVEGEGEQRNDSSSVSGLRSSPSLKSSVPGLESSAQDEAPKGVFAMALDEAIAEDAGGSRHANTPLENCRAKDPMFCPYHGQKAIENWIHSEMQYNVGLTGGGHLAVIKVADNGKGAFTVTITANKGDAAARNNISMTMKSLLSKKGIVPTGVSTQTASGIYDVPGSNDYKSEFSAKPDYDKEQMLSEWADDLMIDVSSDPQLQQEIDPKEFADFLGKLDAVGQAQAGTPARDAALADAEKAYHMLRGQVEYKGVSSEVQLMQDAGTAEVRFNIASQSYHHLKSEVDAVKKILFKNGKFPNGFAKANPFAAKYNAAAQGAGYFADKSFHDADDEYVPLMKALQSRKPTPAELQRLKGLVSAVKFGEKNYVVAVDNYFTARKEFLRELYDWATGTMPGNGALRYHPSIIQRAFPKGRP